MISSKWFALSTTLSSRSPFLPSYAASLSSRPSCSVATSTSGLAVTDVAEPVYEPDCFPRRPFLSRPRFHFADLPSLCFLLVESSCSAAASPAVTSSCSVSSAAPRVWSGPVPPSRLVGPLPGSVKSSCPVFSVTVSHCSPVSSVAASPAVACGCSVSSAAPCTWSGPVPPSCSVGPVAAPRRLLPSFCSPASKPVIRPSLFSCCRPVFPVVCFVLVIDLFYKWLPIINCFVSIKISLTNLVFELLIQKNFYSQTGLVRLI